MMVVKEAMLPGNASHQQLDDDRRDGLSTRHRRQGPLLLWPLNRSDLYLLQIHMQDIHCGDMSG